MAVVLSAAFIVGRALLQAGIEEVKRGIMPRNSLAVL
jgi:hypothetical protein